MSPAPADRSVGVALVLTFLFGPLGLLYATVAGGLVLTVIALVVGLFTVGFGLFVIWPISMIWGAVTAGRKHQAYEAWRLGQLGAR
jgi:hypothetical protein